MLEDKCGREIFLITGDVTDCAPVDIEFLDDWEAAVESLSAMDPSVYGDSKVFHGVLTSASHIPINFFSKEAYVLIMDPDDLTHGVFSESECTDGKTLATNIEQIVNERTDIDRQFMVTIDNTFIFYGYEIQTCLSISDEDIDEETIETCKRIAEQIHAVGGEGECNP